MYCWFSTSQNHVKCQNDLPFWLDMMAKAKVMIKVTLRQDMIGVDGGAFEYQVAVIRTSPTWNGMHMNFKRWSASFHITILRMKRNRAYSNNLNEYGLETLSFLPRAVQSPTHRSRGQTRSGPKIPAVGPVGEGGFFGFGNINVSKWYWVQQWNKWIQWNQWNQWIH